MKNTWHLKRRYVAVCFPKLCVVFESDISPINAQDAATPLNLEEINRINNQNKEIHFLVKIDRIKIRNIGNYSNVFCKFKFADKIPFKVSDSQNRSLYRLIFFLLRVPIGDPNLVLNLLLLRD